MDFTNFYNIKTEQVGGWAPPPGAQLTAMQTVNPVMHLAARAGIHGLVTSAPTSQTHHVIVQPANDTAFPGAAPLRHNPSIQHRQPQQAHIIQPTAQHTIKQQVGTEQIHIKTQYTHPPQKEKPRLYKCGECDKAFMKKEHLKRHALVHTGGRPSHTCEVPGCNKTYSSKDLLTNHLKYIHLGVQPERAYLCIDCGKDFVRKDHMQRHKKNVHGTGPMATNTTNTFSAPITSTQFVAVPVPMPTKQGKRVPITPDSPKRKYPCDTCGKGFIRKDHLQRHQKNVHHQGEQPAVVGHTVEVAHSPQQATITLAPHQAAMSISN